MSADLLPSLILLLALLAVSAELGLLLLTERRRGWPWFLFTLPSRLLLLGVLVFLAFFLGRPISMAGTLTVIAILGRAVAGIAAIMARRISGGEAGRGGE